MSEMAPPWWKTHPDGYEVLDEMVGLSGYEDERLYASYTPNNGIRIGIMNKDGDDGEGEWDEFWREFHLTPDRAIRLGEALTRWGKTY